MSHDLRCYFISDLHLLSRRSRADSFATAIHDAARHAHTIVLGGDIFDFKWSTLPSLSRSIEESMAWLENLVTPHSHCCFHYLLGNHDAHPLFVEQLDRLSFRLPQLFWQPFVLRLGACVFLHGDIVDSDLNHEKLNARRQALGELPPPGRMSHLLYDVVVKARLHRVAIRIGQRRTSVLRKLTQYLTDLGHGPQSGARHVYFGHIHRDMDGIQFGGLTFHNGGASIKGLPFRIVEVREPIPVRQPDDQRPNASA